MTGTETMTKPIFWQLRSGKAEETGNRECSKNTMQALKYEKRGFLLHVASVYISLIASIEPVMDFDKPYLKYSNLFLF